VVILALVIANGVLAGAEIAIVALRATRITELVQERKGAAALLKRLRDDPERLLATIQIGITVAGATASAFGGATVARELAAMLARVAPLNPRLAEDVSLAVVVAGVSFLSLVLGELVPKSIALRSQERYALLVSRPLWVLSVLTRPFAWVLTKTSNVVLALFGDQTTFGESRLSHQEVKSIVEEATETGSVDPRAGEIASRALSLSGLTAGHVMIPRGRVVSLPKRASPEEVRRIVLEEGHTRMPIYEDRIDNVVGYVSVKDIISLAWEGKVFVMEDLLREAYFVPEIMPALDLLQEMRARRVQMAIVVDEAGGMSGIVTLEDLLEELVGEIFSEEDEPAPEPIRAEHDGSLLVTGEIRVRDVNREMSLDLPHGRTWSTVGGLCMALAGRVPRAGEVLLASDGTKLEVLEASQRHVGMVRIVPPPPPAI
jgi:putative hemolysin